MDELDLTDIEKEILRLRQEQKDLQRPMLESSPIGDILLGLGGGLAEGLTGRSGYVASAFDAKNKAMEKRMKALDETETIKGLMEIAKARKDAEKQQNLFEQQMKLQQARDVSAEGRLAKQLEARQIEKASKEEKAPTEGQFKAATFGLRAEQAENDLNNLMDKFDPTTMSASVGKKLPNILQSENVKLLGQAQRNFINAILRKESGAAISPSEFQNAEIQYFPQAGDTPEVLQQKTLNRKLAIAALKSEGSKATGKVTEALNLPIAQVQTKVINGVTYEKVPGGWKKVK